MMKKLLALCLTFTLLTAFYVPSVTAFATEINPSTWAAVDGLGRTLSSNEETGDKKSDKFVGMFYWIWHYTWVDGYEPITTGSVLDKYPEAVNDWSHPAWNATFSGRPYFWDEPLYGFYTNTDEYVLRKHAELLADADIDVVIFDATNGTLVFPNAYEVLFQVWSEAIADGVNVPQIAFMLNFGNHGDINTQLTYLYDNIYSLERYEELWFLWENKPLVMANIGALDLTNSKDREIFNFFTFRYNEPTYFAEDTRYSDYTWGWCSDYPQTKFGKDICGNIEQMCVSVAQNANEYGLTAMNSPIGTVQGRSFTDGAFSYSYTYAGKTVTAESSMENSLLYGLNFQQQWDYAIEQDPEFIFVTGFNEWIAGRWDEWMDTENAFPDQYNPEYSRDIEPSKGVLKDHYYYQLVENVRRFKGTDPLPANYAEKTVDISGDISQWNSVLPEYNHYSGGKNRDSVGWEGYYYKNDTLRNDIVKAKVAYDRDNIYFYVETAEALTPETDTDWMRLLIDTDTTGISPNWEGFEYVINRASPDGDTAILEKSEGELSFTKIADVSYTVKDNVLQIEVPRNLLGLTEDDVKFNFKWSDNLLGSDAMSFYENGDCAPGGRFTFVFDSTATEQIDDKCDLSGITQLFAKIRSFFDSIKSFIIKFFINISN